MHISSLKACPYCGASIAVRGYWRHVPETKFGLPSGLLVYGFPGLACPTCSKNVAISSGWRTLFIIVAWPTLIAALAIVVPADVPGAHRSAIICIGAAAALSAVQWAITPFLLSLEKPTEDEKLNVVSDD
jgi:hypothetical protein